MSSKATGLVDPKLFGDLQGKIDDDTRTRDKIKEIVHELEKVEKVILSTLSNAHAVEEGNGESTLPQPTCGQSADCKSRSF